MQLSRFTKYVAFTAALGLFSACDDFLDINNSPNAVLVAPPNNVLVGAESHLGFLMGSDLHRYTALFVQQFAGQGGAGVQPVDYDRYNITPTDMNNVWRTAIYGSAQADLQKLIEQTQATSPVYAGISKLMQAFLYGVTADSFGDIPFTEALKFADNPQPIYTPSQDVYSGLITLIDDAVADLDKASVLRPSADDLIYGGDIVKWKKFANTLKLRLYLHYYPKLSSTASSNLATLLSQPATAFMTSNADNFQLAFEAVAGKTNPINQFETSRANQFFPSTTLVNMMNAKSDPRRPFYFTESPAGQYTGAGNGTGYLGVNTAFSRIGTFLRGAKTGTGAQEYAGDAPIRMLTYSEYNFILAEYYLRSGNVALAQTKLNDAITASMQMAGVSTAAINTYIASRPALATAATPLQGIIEEKFVANYGVAVEPWSDWRRTGFPALTPVSINPVLTQIPRILPYSDVERTANPINTPARTDLTAPSVFWDPGR
jgi:hypothetical protein